MTATTTTLSSLAAHDPLQVGPFRTEARLGMGGMGVVYLATGPSGEQVAVKVMRDELADQPSFRTRFVREVAAARAVQGAYTARLIDASTDSAPRWIASEYVPGPTLAEYVETSGPLPAEQVRLLGFALAEALQAIHAAGLIHRDLKPSNVILGAGGPKVIDFGIAHAADATSITRTGDYVGSLAWMSPEEVTGAELTPAADIFAWGLVVAFAALGRHPFGEGRPEAVAVRTVNQQPDLHGLARSLRRGVAAALTADPRVRATPQQLRALLMSDQGAAVDLTSVISESWDATIVGVPTILDGPAARSAQLRNGVAATTPRRWRRSVPAFLAGAALAVGAGAGALTLRHATEGSGGDTEAASTGNGSPAAAPDRASTLHQATEGAGDATASTPTGGGALGPEPDMVNDLYPVSWADGVTVHGQTRKGSEAIQWLPYQTVVHVVCRTRGEAAVTKTGMTTTWWDRIDFPVSGYMTDARINTGGYPPDVPTC